LLRCFLAISLLLLPTSVYAAGSEKLVLITGENVSSNGNIMKKILPLCGKIPVKIKFIGSMRSMVHLPNSPLVAKAGCHIEYASAKVIRTFGVTRIPAWGYTSSKGKFYILYGDEWNIQDIRSLSRRAR